MSRTGNAPITIPDGVTVTRTDDVVEVTGPKGTLSQALPGQITMSSEDGVLRFARPDDSRESKAMHGLVRALVNNMVVGVTDGYRRELEIVGVGYRANAKNDTTLELSLGYSHPIEVSAPEGVTFEVPGPTQVYVVGIDKQKVGQVAADIRSLRKPEPYKGKGVRYAGERIIRKAGKAAK